MKKLFLAVALLLFTSTTFAFTLTGIIADKLSNEGIPVVQITLDGKKKLPSKGKGVFTIPNIDITAGNPAKIVFSKDAYLDLAGTLEITSFFVPNSSEPIYLVSFNGENIKPDKDWNYVFEMMPKPIEIISGKITAKRNGDKQDLLWDKIEITAKDADGEILQVDTKEKDDEYTVVSKLFY